MRQQKHVVTVHIPVAVRMISGANEPDQWRNAALWNRVLRTHRVMISIQVFLDALHHGYNSLGRDISLLAFDEAHHAVDNHPYNRTVLDELGPVAEAVSKVISVSSFPCHSNSNTNKTLLLLSPSNSSVVSNPAQSLSSSISSSCFCCQ